MKVTDVFMCYYAAECVANDRPRHAAKVSLTCTTDAGMVDYEWAVSFFPHDDEEDFAVSYDAEASRNIYCAKGRRAKSARRNSWRCGNTSAMRSPPNSTARSSGTNR